MSNKNWKDIEEIVNDIWKLGYFVAPLEAAIEAKDADALEEAIRIHIEGEYEVRANIEHYLWEIRDILANG